MTLPLRRFIRLPSASLATALVISGAAGIASGGEVIHVLEHVNTPQQNVCQGVGCAVNTQTYAWHQTQWRRWPGTAKLLPNPGRGDRIEPISAQPQFDMPAPAGPATSAPPVTSGGIRTPVSAPASPRRTAAPAPRSATPGSRGGAPLPPSATSATPRPSDPAGPPIDLDRLFQNETTPAPSTTPEATEPGDIPPPFDSDAAQRRSPVRTLSALSAGLKASKPPTRRAAAPADPWQPATVRKVNDERSAVEGPVLNEPNLMPNPADAPALRATPSFDGSEPVEQASSPASANRVMDADVSPVASWDAAAIPTEANAETVEGNPLRARGAAGTPRRSNPLRRN